ncbi:MAG: PilN domain-containing protein [Capsulimonadaceae bacterium]
MSKKDILPLHIEWTPDWVQAVNITTGQTGSGPRIADLGSLLQGQRQALVGVGRGLVFLKTVPLPRAAREDLRKLLTVQAPQLFPLPADQLVFDFVQTAVQSVEGIMTVVMAMRADDLRRLKADLQHAGLTAARILPVALAAPAVLTQAGHSDAVLVDGNSEATGMDVVLAGVLRLSRRVADGAEIACELQRTRAAVRTSDLPVVTAGSSTVTGAKAAPVSLLSLLHEAPPLFDFELTEERVKLEGARAATHTRQGVLFLGAALVLLTMVAVNRQDAQAKVNSANAAWSRQMTARRRVEMAAADKAADVTAVQNELNSALQPAQPLSDVIGVVADSLPAGAWLTGLTLERGKPLQVRGTARTSDDVAHFVGALGNSTRFRDVSLVFANSASIGNTPVVQFTVSAVCVGNLPMPAPLILTTRSVPAPTTGATQ